MILKKESLIFIKNLIVFVGLPGLFILGYFVINDPFLILSRAQSEREIANYYSSKCRVGTNLEHLSLMNLGHQLEKKDVNSFIFGSSRAGAFDPRFWEKKFLVKGDHAFLLNASGDSLLGITRKIQYLDKQNINLKNVILTFDLDSLRAKEKKMFLLIDSPLVVSSFRKKAEFYFQHLKTFLNPKFILPFVLSKITNGRKCNTDLNKFVLVSKKTIFDPKSNFRYFAEIEKQIETDPSSFYGQDSLKDQFSKKEVKVLPKVLDKKQQELLRNISRIFSKHNTSYKILIHPGWQTEHLHAFDLGFIKEIFDEENVYDLTINKWNKKIENWYDEKHPRPHVTKEIISLLYEKD